MNMSYCRFHNTSMDLTDCLETLIDQDDLLSADEWRACQRMFRNFLDFCQGEGLVEYDEEELEEFLINIPHKAD